VRLPTDTPAMQAGKAAMLGITLPEDNLHSPNKRLKLDQIYRGAEMTAAFYDNLRSLKKT